ncbi:MAG TPA: NYN domain-containing protein [Planctomycetota bacterium]|nr:NYN domain-containing protein [Planctomycetota bacterium]
MLLIDGYNVLFKMARGIKDGRRLAEERDRLVSRICRHCSATHQRARVFFDPKRGGGTPGFDRIRKLPPVEVVQLAEGSADDAIKAIVASGPDRTAYRVVSSDREVADAARKRSFESMPAEEFLAELERGEAGAPAEKPDGLGPDGLKYWMDQFGLGGTPR